MDILANLQLGFGEALSLNNLLFCFIGCLLGTVIGILPGIGPIATIAMLLPITFGLDPLPALIMLAGIYYGSTYGGSTTAILVNLPGEAASVVTCIDGYQMARNGQAGAALAIAAIGSFIAGTVGTILIATFGPILASVARNFSSPDYFSLMAFGLISAIVLAHGSVLKAIGMIFVGILLSTVGTDMNTGVQRYVFDIPMLSEGIGFLPIALGLFGLAEIIKNLETVQTRTVLQTKISGLMISRQDFMAALPAILRGTGLGSLLGILPGGGAVLSSFASYALERKISRTPSRFGKGAIEGVAGPESANNAGAQTGFIPLLTLGIPSNAVMALIMGALLIQGIAPGTKVMTSQPTLFWGLIASMWIGNAMLLVINLPLVRIWVSLLRIPYHLLFPAILVFVCIGVYSINNSSFDVMIAAVMGVAGYILSKLGFEAAPLLLGFILGPLMEENLRRSLLLSHGDPMIFLQRPISAGILVLSVILLLLVLVPAIKRGRSVAFEDAD